MLSVLLVDDEPSIQHAFRRVLRDDGWQLRVASTAAQAVAEMQSIRPDVVVLDVHLPDASGLETFDRLKALDARTPVILITGHGTTDLAIEAIKRGAYEYLLKPLDLSTLRGLIRQAGESSQRMHVPAVLPEDVVQADEGDRLIGRCPAMQVVYKQIGRVAAQDVTVLILGESGTGKELVARAIYQHSHRADKPFLAINCASIPENLLESELFGHERGAFTGADRKRIGKFEQCHGGTIFLDEVGDMAPLTQTKILRLMQEQRFERVGGNETIQTDVRMIAATNADLERQVAAGKFRGDLHFRLNVFSIHLPPLRERGDDIVHLVEHYLRRYSRELNREVQGVAPEALEVLRNYPWPGNVRELQSVIKQVLLQLRDPVVTLADIPSSLLPSSASVSPAPVGSDGDLLAAEWSRFVDARIVAGSENLYAEAVAAMEHQVITRVLRHTGGNQLQAARILGMARNSLRTRIRALKINIGRTIDIDPDFEDGDLP
ncbi:MAG: sigma-54 dependent transcriptional regulator [Planctomycetota bacterium]|nr:sigma-54 dependent transcriptional regulator [Planctomycetota bacterium]